MSFYNEDTEIIDLTIDSDHDSSPLSTPPPSPVLFQGFNSNSLSKATFLSKINSQPNDVANYKRKHQDVIEEEEFKRPYNMPRKSRSFIVDDYEIEEEAKRKRPKYDDIKWDNLSETDNSWETAETVNDWNEEIDDIESFYLNEADQLIAIVLWESGLRSVHLLDELHEKVPKKMCQWYSSQLRISDEN